MSLNSVLGQDKAVQQDTSWKKIYRYTSTRINDLIHTKLDVRFDYPKSYMYGKEWVTIKPHFYPTDTLTLDAKGMDIKAVDMVRGSTHIPLRYIYDSLELHIKLDRTYNRFEPYTIYLDYTSKPNAFKSKGSNAITDAKGLYFINPTGQDKSKPTQIWTQGETESNSVWFPTIDKPNQKTTEEILMTVPSKYVTLSNGSLMSQKKNTDGTRTDYWKLDLPHAPYLFFMGVGEYSIIKDNYKGKEVAYYVEKEYAPYAKKIFGETPEMIGFYEKITGVNFPWPKYDQIVGRDYVSGAMENTTATLHQESAYQNARQLVDGNRWEDVISHELFHQWFGDLVTAESWSNITVNESMADYSETLWNEFRHGKDAGDLHIQENRLAYLNNPADAQKNLVRFYYSDKEDVFDQISYPKGGTILHMLRNYVGDSAFFKSLNKYLIDNKFKSAEADNLRLAFEDVTGQDLSWFWNQWYYGSGHPKLKISYNYTEGKSSVIIEQQQNTGKIFRLPIAIDIYNGSNKSRHKVWIENKTDTFTFNTPVKPDLINVDAEKMLLVEKTDNKTADNFIHQFKYAGNYLDRHEALEYFSKNKMKELAEGLNDKFYDIRLYTLKKLEVNKDLLTPDVIIHIEKLANSDPNKIVQAQALGILTNQNDKKYIPLFTRLADDSSYTVSGTAIDGISKLDVSIAYQLSKKYIHDAKGKLGIVVPEIILKNGTENDFDIVNTSYKNYPPNQEKIHQSITYGNYLATLKNEENIKKGVQEIMVFRNQIPQEYQNFTDPSFKSILDKLSKVQRGLGKMQLADYIDLMLK